MPCEVVMWYLNKDYIFYSSDLQDGFNLALFLGFMENTPCANSYLLLCMTLEVHSDLLSEGFTRLQRVFV